MRKFEDFQKPNGIKCEHCGGDCIDRCLRCGAPICCPKCCEEATEELFNQLYTLPQAVLGKNNANI